MDPNLEVCPTCGHDQPLDDCYLGRLGNLRWLRCRACGQEWNQSLDSTPCESDD